MWVAPSKRPSVLLKPSNSPCVVLLLIATTRGCLHPLCLSLRLQCQDEYGEVCPAGWHKGAATIKPDPTSKLEYFSQAGGALNGDVEMAVNGKKRPGEPLEKDAKKART
jgi:C-terminal domain of 1-Cys peroxiredoxin